MTVVNSYRKYKYLRGTHKALKMFATKLKYEVVSVRGKGGVHLTNELDFFKIQIGKNQPLEDKVICLAHEVGHALDIAHSPFTVAEKSNMHLKRVTTKVYMREVVAWDKAFSLLRDMGCLEHVSKRFDLLKMASLRSYAIEISK